MRESQTPTPVCCDHFRLASSSGGARDGAPLDLVFEPPFEDQERPEELGVVVRTHQVLPDQAGHDRRVEEAATLDRLDAQAFFELVSQVVPKPMSYRRSETPLGALDEIGGEIIAKQSPYYVLLVQSTNAHVQRKRKGELYDTLV